MYARTANSKLFILGFYHIAGGCQDHISELRPVISQLQGVLTARIMLVTDMKTMWSSSVFL